MNKAHIPLPLQHRILLQLVHFALSDGVVAIFVD